MTMTPVASVAFAVPKTTHWELPLRAERTLLPASATSLLLAEPSENALTIAELDAAKLEVVRSQTLLDKGSFIAWARSHDRVYVLFSRDEQDAHRLVALDAATFDVVAESVTRDALLTGALGPRLEPGTLGVRVSYVKPCREDPDGCAVFETHAIGMLAVAKVRTHGMSHPRRVPDDQGADNSLPTPDPGWKLDAEAQAVVSSGGRSIACPIHGTIIGSPMWIGHRMFVVTSGCCGGPKGGFFVCDTGE